MKWMYNTLNTSAEPETTSSINFQADSCKGKNICGLREQLLNTFSIRKSGRYLESQKQAASLTQRKAIRKHQPPKTTEVVWQFIIIRPHSACLETCEKR